MRALIAAAALAFATPAFAVENISVALQNGASLFTCSNGQACDQSSSPTAVVFGSETVGDVQVLLTAGTQEFDPDRLSLGLVQITNLTASPETLLMAISAVNYPVGAVAFHETASFTLDSGSASATGAYWTSAANVLGAKASGTDLPGVELGSGFSTGPLTTTSSFSFNGSTPFTVAEPFGMSEGVALVLGPHAEVTSSGISISASAVPEPSTWAMLLLGFLGLGLGRSFRNRLAVY
jgi:hypothetical protein